MKETLKPNEIGALMRAALGGRKEARSTAYTVELWDARSASQIVPDELRTLTTLHESFARNLADSLSTRLRLAFTAKLISAEHLAYGGFLQRVPATTYLACCRLGPTRSGAVLQLDLQIASAIVDLLLGGEGKSLEPSRTLTEIESQVLDPIPRLVCRELRSVWQALSLEIDFEESLDLERTRHLMPPEAKILFVGFEISMLEVTGKLNLAFPATVSNALLRKLSGGRPVQSDGDSRKRLMRRLLDCPVTAELAATDVRVRLSSLAGLAPGKFLPLARSAEERALLLVAGRPKFYAVPARCGQVRAAQLVERTVSKEKLE